METICGRRVLGSTRLLRVFAEAPRLTRGARLCYLVMAAYGRDSGECYTSSTTLARVLGASKRAVKRWWWELRREGWIHPQWVPGKPTHHVFPWHRVFAEASPAGGDRIDIPPMPKPAPGGDRIVTHMYRNHVQDSRSSSPTTKLQNELRAEIWAYFQAERTTQVKPPDKQIIQRCLEAMHGHSIDELRLVLRDRFRRGFRPGTARGPRDYTWFPAVIANAFRPRE